VYAAPFDYLRAGSWQEAVALLSEHGEDARVIAGGQSLMPLMMLRLAEPTVLVDVADVGSGAVEEQDGWLVVPALTRHVELERGDLVRARCGVVAEAAGRIGNLRVRNRGTIGGSLAHADPSAELPCVTLALDGRVRTLSAAGTRTISAADLFLGYFETALGPGELITHVELPVLPERCGAAFTELNRRADDFATVEAAAVVTLGADGTCSEVRLAVGAVAHRPLDVSDSVGALVGERVTDAAVAVAARAAAAGVDITLTAHGSRAYQRRMLEVFTGRALRAAAARAGGSDARSAA
jgi:CO/xanthine dehydrogenase FAD-binding subunit